MKKIVSLIFAFAVLCSLCGAQSFNSGYFLDHYHYGYTINPASQPDKEITGHFGMFIGNINVQAQSNVGLATFFYPSEDKLLTAFNKNVPANEFLGKLNDVNSARLNLNENFLNVGARSGKNGYFTFDAGLKANVDASIPKSVFEMLKVGVGDQNTYSINDINIWANSYVELALGYSYNIADKVFIGARAKALVGLAQAQMNIESMSVSSATGKTTVSGAGSMGVACKLLNMGSSNGVLDLGSLSRGDIGFAGFGLGFDLGVSAKPIDGLSVDLALQNIGNIKWNRNIVGEMAFQNKELTGGDVNVKDFLEFKSAEADKITEKLPSIFRFGAKYAMPFYENLSARVLGTFVGGEHSKYTDIRIGATITPIRQISATVNYGFTSNGGAFGGAINFNLGSYNIFFGADSIINTLNPQYIPVNPTAMAYSVGINVQYR